MARLPTPGGDNGNWGDLLNDYLSQSHKTDGTIKDNAVTANNIAPGAVTSAKIASDAVGASQIADGSITNAQIADGTIAETKLANAVQTKLNASSSPSWSSITGKPSVIAAGNDQTAARLVINAAASKTIFVNDYGADPTGTTASDTAIASALAALGTNKGIIEFGTGTYRLNSSKTLGYPGQFFKGQGMSSTTIDFRGTGPALQCWDSTVPTNGSTAPGRGGGVLGGMTIDGINNTNANSIGLQIGDLINPLVENVRIFGFINPGSIGFLGQNRYSWTEYGRFRVVSDYSTNCFVFESHPSHPLPYGGKSSWSYNIFDFGFSAETNQNGVFLRNHVDLTGVQWLMNFNCNPGTTNTAVAITVGKDNSDKSGIEGFLSWQGEVTNAGAIGHKDMNIGSLASIRGYGALVFHDYAPTATFTAGSAVPYRVVFAGRVNCPSLGHYADIEIPFVTIGDPGRFGAMGDDANYINIEEGDNGAWPTLAARGPSSDIGFLINTKGNGSLEYNGKPVAITSYTAPSAWNSPGSYGQTVTDGTYLYVCVAENVWKKIPLQNM